MSNGQSPEEIMAHEEAMHLLQSQNNEPNFEGRAHLLDTVIESELEVSDDALANLRAKDFPLSNFDEGTDTVEFKWMQEILDMFYKAQYPHPGSGLQGLSRAWAAGDSSERYQALSLDEYVMDEGFKLGTFSRAKRGEDMAQQESSGKMIQENHAVREDTSSSGGGLLGRWRS